MLDVDPMLDAVVVQRDAAVRLQHAVQSYAALHAGVALAHVDAVQRVAMAVVQFEAVPFRRQQRRETQLAGFPLHAEQGFEMGRPSIIELEIIIEKGALTGGRIGGEAVIVARGELYV